jgi:polyphosphate kinase
MTPRNLNRRVELAFPIQNPRLVRHLCDDILETYLQEEAGRAKKT